MEDEALTEVRELTKNQIAFVEARLGTATDKEAAEQIGLSPQTVYNWPNKQEIDELIRELSAEALAEARRLVQYYSAEAIEVIHDEMQRGQRDRLNAAKAMADRAGLTSQAGPQFNQLIMGQNVTVTNRKWERAMEALSEWAEQEEEGDVVEGEIVEEDEGEETSGKDTEQV